MILNDKTTETDGAARDMAARAAWLSFVGGMTQDQIAQELGISRQRAQRLVARAATEGLIRVRIDHPIAACMELERRLIDRFNLDGAWVAPCAGRGIDPLAGLAPFAAPVIERLFEVPAQQVIALGTGRTLRQIAEHMQQIDGSHHKLVSLIGNVAPDGSASLYEVIVRLAEKTSAPHFPMSIPVVAGSETELELYRALPHVNSSRALAQSADLAVVGIGQMSLDAPLLVDGFITAQEHADWVAAGAVGEICGHAFNAQGRYLDHAMNRRIVGVQVNNDVMPIYCIAGGPKKIPALTAALKGRLMTHLITDESTAKTLLQIDF
ncbi:DNA-binding transcriptional regulator [Thioclava sp. SK-1]|uniref:sugar-binding transcriptional regulator n=1 Tax=Thioclava sp. SK-1 TaxID=1889770 RepID=UPI000824D463|nr:sugar-binding transcriptional regulator [Thioclava sp. SK-1]OCX66601.1 DNA-binding transcriptional regulator [Thioclava sp. SK-1]